MYNKLKYNLNATHITAMCFNVRQANMTHALGIPQVRWLLSSRGCLSGSEGTHRGTPPVQSMRLHWALGMQQY